MGTVKNHPSHALAEYRRCIGRRRSFTVLGYGPHMLIEHSGEWISRPLFIAWRKLGLTAEDETGRGVARYVATGTGDLA